MKTIGEFPGWLAKQTWTGKLLLGCSGCVLLFCCCGTVAALFVTPTQALRTTASAGIASLPSDSLVTPLPTFTEQTTPSPEVILFDPTATPVLLPTATSTPAITVVIIGMNKVSEYVDLQNNGSVPVDLSDWVLVSKKGDQRCPLSGELPPGQILRVWSRSNKSGFSCHFPNNIWNNDGVDPAVLYNPQGLEVSRYPQ